MSVRRAIVLAVGVAFVVAAAAVPATAGRVRDILNERRAAKAGESDGAPDDAGATEARQDPAGFVRTIAGARVLTDVAYGRRAKETMDIYLPAAAQNAPVIFMVHGGAWMVGDKSNRKVVENKVAHYLPKGFIVVSVNYPLVPEIGVLEQGDAIRTALAFAQHNAPEWGGDPARFVVFGHSAGAHLVALVSADPKRATEAFGVKPWRATVALDSAAYDLVPIMEARFHFRFYDTVFGTDRNLWRAASPLHQLSREIAPPPMLLVCSTRRAESCTQAKAFAAAAKAGYPALAFDVLAEDMSHGEINGQVGTAGAYTLALDSFIAKVLR